jgi:mono/diheme cytochrome c family protein
MRSHKNVIGWFVAAGLVVSAQGLSAQQAKAPAAASVETQRTFLNQYCVSCHNDRNKAAVRGFSLDGVDVAVAGQNGELWEKVIKKLRAGQMPPAGSRQPGRPQSDLVAGWLENEIDVMAAKAPNPGRTESLHRLNRTEYGNIVRDLFGLDISFDNWLPPDPLGGGEANFDNIATSLRLSQGLLEQYLSVAKRVSRTAVGGVVPVTTETFKVNDALPQDRHLEGLPFGTRGGISVNFPFPLDATYVISISVSGNGNEHLEVSIDGEQVKTFDLEAGEAKRGRARSKTLEIRSPVKAGQRRIVATFVKDKPLLEWEADRMPFTNPAALPPSGGAARSLPRVEQLVVVGPHDTTGKGETDSRKKVFLCYPANAAEEEPCARKIISNMVKLGFRRPVKPADLNLLMAFYEEGRAEEDFDSGIEKAIRALLVSPEFIYRFAYEPKGIAPGVTYRVPDLELASRLSFFLWSSIPDSQLLDLAVAGRLKNPVVLEEQVRRMLADPRSIAMTKSFGNLYLWVRNVGAMTPATTVYPNFDEGLRNSMGREMELFFDSIRMEDRSLVELLDAKYTFVDERLAKHYGMPGIRGAEFRKVNLADDSPRRGILGKASLLLVTSVPQRTSPVKRGKWVLDNILGTPPPPPPANVPALPDQKQADGSVMTMRETMATHRRNPVCSGCHNVIDPVGFALEQFDAIGKWREVDASFTKIDPMGAMPDGSKFGTLAEFRALITSRPDPFLRTFTEKLLMYALGRGYESYDAPTVRKVLKDAEKGRYRFSDVVLGIVKSSPFQMRRGSDGLKPAGVTASR